jgi:hypothetical protein
MSIDTLGREAAQRARAAVERMAVPDASAVVGARRRRRNVKVSATGAVVLLVVLAGSLAAVRAGDSSRAPRVSVQPTGPTTSPAPIGDLEFRAVEYDGLSPLQFPATATQCTSPPSLSTAGDTTVLVDRGHDFCYYVGPVLLTGASVDGADVLYDSTSSQWAVNLRFGNRDFLTRVAAPLVNKEIAITLNGVVQSAPLVNPGITGRDVEITGDFTQDEAVNVAASIMGIAPSSVRVDTAGAPNG